MTAATMSRGDYQMRHVRMLTASWFLCFSSFLACATDVLTSRNDLSRTGANLTERVLTTTNVNPARFGKLFSYNVAGNIYAQPLIVTGVATAIGKRNVLYVATTDNNIYAFDADGPRQSGGHIWERSLSNPATAATAGGGSVTLPLDDELPVYVRKAVGHSVGPIPWNDPTHYEAGRTTFVGNIGIMSTPVIDRVRGAIYFVARTREENRYVQTLHALDLATGKERSGSPVVIAEGSSQVGFAALQNQRAGLALVRNSVIVAWGSPGGKENNVITVGNSMGTYHGYVMAFDADTLAQTGCFTTGTPTRSMIGFWQAGRAPVVDPDGYVYFFSGNGADVGPIADNRCNPAQPKSFPASGDLANSLLKFDPRSGLSLVDATQAGEHIDLDVCDMDLGGSGPMRVPGTDLLVGGGKQGFLYLFGKSPGGRYQSLQEPIKVYDGPVESTDPKHPPPPPGAPNVCLEHGMHHVMGGPVYWESGALGGRLYVSVESEVIKMYKLDKTNRRISPTPLSRTSRVIYQHPGAILALSANGNRRGTAILWAAHADRTDATPSSPFWDKQKGVLRAYDADDLARELWNSDLNPSRDGAGDFAKFTPPTVANGKVYLATFSGQVVVYGLLPAP